MLNRTIALFAVGAATLGGCASPPASRGPTGPHLDYTVTLERPVPGASVDVELRASGLPGQTLLTLPCGNTATMLDAPLIEDLRVVRPPGARLAGTDDPYVWVLESGPEVTLAWRVPHRFREHPRIRELNDEHEFPYVGTDHAQLYTATLLLAPPEPEVGEIRVRFEVPPGWPVRAPWAEVDGTFLPRRDQLQDDYVAVGHWTERRVKVGEFEVWLAFAPSVLALADDVAEAMTGVLADQFDLWGRRPAGQYLVVLGDPQEQRLAGSPKTSSMTLSADPGLLTVAPEWLRIGIVHIVAHEFHHVWTQNQPALPGRLRFYKEGFTDYAAWLLCARRGTVDADGWRRRLAEALVEVEGMRMRQEVSLADAGGELSFEVGEGGSYILNGGLLVALWLDLALREAAYPDGLDGWMRAFNNDPARKVRAPTLEEFLAVVAADLGTEAAAELRRMVTTPGGIDPATLLTRYGLEWVDRGPVRFALPAGPWDVPARPRDR